MAGLYTPELADTILKRLESETLRQICKDQGMPAASTVVLWTQQRPDFAERYAQARGVMLENMAEEILEIADDGTNDYVERETAAGGMQVIVDQDHIQRSRLRVDSRKWLLSKLRPDKYGDRTAVDLRTPEGIVVNVTNIPGKVE